jgi:hypothetical protein
MNLKGKYEFREFAMLFLPNTEQHQSPSCEVS